jgi:sugar lactone lactonase YvrE
LGTLEKDQISTGEIDMPTRKQKSLVRRSFIGRVGTLAAGGMAAAACFAGPRDAGAKEPLTPPFPQRLPARPFPQGLPWLNTAHPIDLRELRGKFVLLDFWTLGCINCMHIIPELHKLEKAWPNDLVVIGVHSAKFAREKKTDSIKEAVLRYRIEHPVVNDSDFAIWNSYGVQAWPSLVLIDPEGYAVWGHSGEITFEQVNALLSKAAPFYRAGGMLDGKPIRFDLESAKMAQTPLRFPGKILADESGGRLLVADSGHNRIVVTRLDGSLLSIIGSGAIGRADGDYAAAEFNTPQGMALDGETLYVADTENHLIRKVDLSKKRVTTIAGTGQQSRDTPPFGHTQKPLATALSSPWDLCIHGHDLYIAMAGVHQLWIMKLDGSGIGVYAGNGREDIVDGPVRPVRPSQPGFASFAQPSGLASDGRWLYVADSEGSSIRAVPFDARKGVRTIVGTAHLPSARLFTFGDVDGRGDSVRLQHPLGITYYDGKLYVADTYNNKIKTIDPATGGTQTIVGSETAGRTDDPPAFDQPGGIAAAAGKLYVADTNNHLIRVIDLRRANRVSTLATTGL